MIYRPMVVPNLAHTSARRKSHVESGGPASRWARMHTGTQHGLATVSAFVSEAPFYPRAEVGHGDHGAPAQN